MREFLEKNYTDEAIETDGLTIKLVIKALLEVSLPLRLGRPARHPHCGSVPLAGRQGWRPQGPTVAPAPTHSWHSPGSAHSCLVASEAPATAGAEIRRTGCTSWEPEGFETLEMLKGGARGRGAGWRAGSGTGGLLC